jgi:HprK-related kinase A
VDLSGSGVVLPVGPFLIQVRSDMAGVATHLGCLYADFDVGPGSPGHFDMAIVATPGVRRWWRPQANLYVNGTKPFVPIPASLSGPLLEWGLNWCIGAFSHRWVSVHAAVLERNGRALVLFGASGSGKSTLCAALTLDGWRLFSDEFALVDLQTGLLAPLPRPIALKEAAIDIIAARARDAVFSREAVDMEGHRFVHMRPPRESVRRSGEMAEARWILAPRYTAGVATSLEPLAKAHALFQLAGQSFSHSRLGASGFECLKHLVARTECYTLEYSDLDDVLPRLRALSSG